MSYNILTIPKFDKDFKKLAKKYKRIKIDLTTLLNDLIVNPKIGISLGDNIYKIRMANSSIPTGKSGGFRVISYYLDEDNNIFLLSIYSKSDKESITNEEIKEALKEVIL